jgi:hypothetical protein
MTPARDLLVQGGESRGRMGYLPEGGGASTAASR